jgi:SAM-dependent methyltransferase
MVALNDFVVCSVCHADLSLEIIKSEGSGLCPECGRRYTFTEGVFDMTPLPPPDEVLRSKWDTWEKLQDNGLQSYTSAPEFNLSIGQREDAQAFKAFARPAGLILDVGCGPQSYPSYLPEGSRVVGIDPLLGQQPRGFSFIRGIGEYLPFRDETFDHILYASSLDHIIDPRRSLRDAARCLKSGGRISLWIDGLSPDESANIPSRWERYQTLARKGFKSLSRHSWLSKLGLRRTLSYMTSVARMKVPAGASDYFHFAHLNADVVFNWLNEVSLTIIGSQDYPAADSVFVQAKK